MADTARIERVARHLFEGRKARTPFQWLAGDLKLDSLDEAYAAQTVLHRLWAADGQGRIAGWKIAVTSKAMMDLVGIDQPCVGAVLDGNIQATPAVVSLAAYQRLGLEFELAVRMGADVPAADAPYDAASIARYVDTVMPAFELIDDREADYAGFEAPSLVADNTWNGGVVLGPASTAWRDMDMAAVPVTLRYNGETETAVTGAAMGNPFTSLAYVANNLLGRGVALEAGHIVITGSTVKTRFAKAGDHAVYAIDGLGAVEATVTA
jgi:2-keto-4-pentenoate hydratase